LAFRWSPIAVLRSELAEGAAVLGGAALALRAILDDPASVPTEPAPALQ
jgi:hypothetical protein